VGNGGRNIFCITKLSKLGSEVCYSVHCSVHFALGIHSRNHLTDLTQAINTTLCLSFRSLQELRLNDTLVSWNEIRLLLSGLPHLKDLEAGYNEYTQLTVACTLLCLHVSRNINSTKVKHLPLWCNTAPDVTSLSENAPTDGRLEILNLDSNALTDWIDIANALSSFPR
jgi:hypothetical protein